jgi:phosphoribosyl-dephospho-CoA transferase
VVVRRAEIRDGLVPVGIRGELREQRFASWISADAVLELVTARTLARCRSWSTADPVRRAAVPALAALDDVEEIMGKHGFGRLWGPTGSVGFELGSARATATVSSDLDLVVEVDRLDGSGCTAAEACSLLAALAALPVRVDVLLETLHGAVALSEYARPRSESGSFILRTTAGPRLIRRD